eukprot:TRINITY_DN10919_c0_g2_i4.p1 TRINITY_DN10919_c0_g2~~TRINITY_DN10919_c0_g2_i4.p1  ORF type:complete len:223 (+),score=35.71 TRINITY_DN10919_c0_g2_i4:517-1185(+)
MYGILFGAAQICCVYLRQYTGKDPPKGINALVLKTWNGVLISHTKLERNAIAKKVSTKISKKAKSWSGLNKAELWKVFTHLRKRALPAILSTLPDAASIKTKKQRTNHHVRTDQCAVLPNMPQETITVPMQAETTTTNQGTKRKRNASDKPLVLESIMDLYLHVIVMHMPDFYEKMDFKNVNTERAEGFLAKMKRILSDFTTRDFKSDQTLREVIIRHAFQA